MIHLFGIRHHGPGSARSLKRALEKLQPDCLLIEGPPEADSLLPLIGQDMTPPVALLLYAKEDASRAVFYPFAEFSPEWQALHYGVRQHIPTRFFDLPVSHRLVREVEHIVAEAQEKITEAPEHLDPLSLVAKAAGYEDFEVWWGQLVEERLDSTEVFTAILEVMQAVRDQQPPKDKTEAQREAYMRQMIRKAASEGYKNIAVVCGAYHAPALSEQALLQHTEDANILKHLSGVNVEATWIPWTFGRLSRFSGYGAGINSPGWYEHLWQTFQPQSAASSVRWLSKISGLLREEGMEASSAQVIEGVRLAETLAAMRGNAKAGLEELSEAAYALFAHGNDLVMQLITEKLIVGERLGSVPADTPAAPLQQDLQKEIKRLRLTQDAVVRDLELDLRKEIDLQRSQLLHRLHLLGISWGHQAYASSKGTFKEAWQLKWEPEYAVVLIEAGRYGQTVASAGVGKILEEIQNLTLQGLSDVLERVLLANLPDATAALLIALEKQSAQDTDILHLMAALPTLARIVRYGDVRQHDETRAAMLAQVVTRFLSRICIGLPNSAYSISDDAAEVLFKHILEVDAAISTLQNEEHTGVWRETLQKLSQGQGHGLIKGRAVRLLLEANLLGMSEVSQQLSLALSNPEVEKASGWLEGFLRGSGLVLLHDASLLRILDDWLAQLPTETFSRILPLLRRTFSSFEVPERRNIGEKVKHLDAKSVMRHNLTVIDHQRGSKVLPRVAELLGLGGLHDRG